MALSLKEIQAKLMEQEARKDRAKGGAPSGDNAVYPFWNNPNSSTATLRFLPDGDELNDFFWVERLIIKLPFAGIKGQPGDKRVEVQVPCVNMWKPNSCPITAEISPWWKQDDLLEMARTYYRKKSYLYQGLVTQNPNKDDQPPENPIRRFIINQSIHDIIKGILMRQDLEHTPTDYDNGRDFYLSKTQKGEYANYTSSSWAMKERALNQDELDAINRFGLFNLSTFLPKKPDDAHLKAMMEMFEASVNGEQYDADRWAEFYKPAGLKTEHNGNAAVDDVPAAVVLRAAPVVPRAAARPVPVPAAVEDDAPFAAEPAPAAKTANKTMTPEQILAMVRNRNQNQ
jgi:hypothetical protein